MRFGAPAAHTHVVSRMGLWFAKNFWQSCRMTERQERLESPQQARLRLGQIVESRRKWLGYRQDNMPNGPSSTTMSAIENGQEVSELSYRRLEKSLGWAKHSVRKIFEGAEPEPLDVDPAPSEPAPPRPEHAGVTVDDLHAMETAPRYLTAWEAALAAMRQVADESPDPGAAMAQNARVAVALANLWADQLLTAGVGPAARPALQRLFLDKQELELNGFNNTSYWDQRQKEGLHAASSDPAPSPQPSASPEGSEIKEAPSTIEVALGPEWPSVVDWSEVETESDIKRVVGELAANARSIHGDCELDLSEFTMRVREHAAALRREAESDDHQPEAAPQPDTKKVNKKTGAIHYPQWGGGPDQLPPEVDDELAAAQHGEKASDHEDDSVGDAIVENMKSHDHLNEGVEKHPLR
ncbi:hypothetical protein [Mycobacteroides abscessus]|uniref:hypothetical protein n=2 Tax=Mycobacteroides abscessus TaxID=36809 RepID=UPI001F2D839A|nr:hypothetical protein [Mycobacteroides abscessus]